MGKKKLRTLGAKAVESLKNTNNSAVGKRVDLAFDVRQFIHSKMDKLNIDYLQMGDKLCMSRSKIERILTCGENLTIKTIAKIYHYLDEYPKIIVKDKNETPKIDT